MTGKDNVVGGRGRSLRQVCGCGGVGVGVGRLGVVLVHVKEQVLAVFLR